MREPEDDRFKSGRRLGVRILAGLGLVLFALFFSMIAAESLGVIEPGTEGSPEDPPPSAAARLGASRPGEAVHVAGALGVLLVGGSGLVGLMARPERSGYSYQVLAGMSGVLLTLPLVGDPDNLGGQAGWIDPVLLVLVLPSVGAALLATPWRRRRSAEGWRPRFLGLAAIAAIPAAWYGVDQALLQRSTFPPTADPHHNGHWWVMAIVAFMVVLSVAAAALPSVGWRLGARVASLAALAIGAASLIAISAASALWWGWAIAAVAWGLLGIWFTVRGPVGERAGAPG